MVWSLAYSHLDYFSQFGLLSIIMRSKFCRLISPPREGIAFLKVISLAYWRYVVKRLKTPILNASHSSVFLSQ